MDAEGLAKVDAVSEMELEVVPVRVLPHEEPAPHLPCATRPRQRRSPPPEACSPAPRRLRPCVLWAPWPIASARRAAPRAASGPERRRQPLLPGRRPPARPVSLELEVRPPSPFRLPRHGSEDGVMRVEGGVALAAAARRWLPGLGAGLGARQGAVLRCGPSHSTPSAIAAPGPAVDAPVGEAGPAELELALERMRFALGVDDDLDEFYRRFRRDPLLGPLLRRRPASAPAPPALALGGACLGGGQAADRERPGRPHPAPHRRPLGPAGRAGPRRPARCSDRRSDRRPGAGRAGVDGPGAEAGDRPARRRRRGRRGPLRPGQADRRPAPAGECARSAPGPCSASASSAAATPTRCPPAT